MFSILGILCVIGGFIVKFFGKRITSSKTNLRYGIVRKIREHENGYVLDVEYSRSLDLHSEMVEVYTRRKPKRTEIILEENVDGFTIYNGKKVILLTSLALWIVGAILCMFG